MMKMGAEDDGLILHLGKRWEEKKENKKMKGRNEREMGIVCGE